MAAIEGIRAQILANASILFPPRRHRRRQHRHHQQDGLGPLGPAHVVVLTRAGDAGFFASLVADPESRTPRALAQGPAVKDVDYALHALLFLTAMLLESTGRTPMMDGRRSAEVMIGEVKPAYVDVVALDEGVKGEGKRIGKKKAEASVGGDGAAKHAKEEAEDDDGDQEDEEDEEMTKESEKEFWERVNKEKREIMVKLEEGWSKIGMGELKGGDL
nr:hypothetical protein CFP56_09446 [Quercus suber]